MPANKNATPKTAAPKAAKKKPEVKKSVREVAGKPVTKKAAVKQPKKPVAVKKPATAKAVKGGKPVKAAKDVVAAKVAKKPAVNIQSDVQPAFQLRSYAWSAKLPLSVLTDFEELSLYDCRFRPNAKDDPAAARLMYVTFDQYADRWDEIAAVLSKEAVMRGD